MSSYFGTGDAVKSPAGTGTVLSIPEIGMVEVQIDEDVKIFSVYEIELDSEDDPFDSTAPGWDATDCRA